MGMAMVERAYRRAYALQGSTHAYPMFEVVGTGGAETVHAIEAAIEAAELGMVIAPESTIAAPGRSPRENLGRVRVVFGPSMTELAKLLGVSRQAIYHWQAGERVSNENASKLEDFAAAAEVVASSGVAIPPGILRRRVAGKGSIADAVQQGRPAIDIASELVETLRAEARQRQRLEARFRARTVANLPEGRLLPPALDETSH